MEFFHVLNRGVDKRKIFLDDRDKKRFVHDLYVMNDKHVVKNYTLPIRQRINYKRKKLVYIHAFCLMPNHYHILLSPIIEGGLSLFMQKLNMGYSKYFNEKYDRQGTLWQGGYRKITINRDAHFLYIPYYIHLNPLDLKYSTWRKGKVKEAQKAISYLEQYKWSSHRDYINKKNFQSIIYKKEIDTLIGNVRNYKKEIRHIICEEGIIPSTPKIEN